MKKIKVQETATGKKFDACILKHVATLDDSRMINLSEFLRGFVAILDFTEDGQTLDDVAHLAYLKNVKQGDYIKLSASDSVYVREEYDKTAKRYAVSNTNDMNQCKYLKGDTIVLIGFTY